MSKQPIVHDSDCARHNEPAYPNGPCNCSASHGGPQTPFDAVAVVEGLRAEWFAGKEYHDQYSRLSAADEIIRALRKAQEGQQVKGGDQTENGTDSVPVAGAGDNEIRDRLCGYWRDVDSCLLPSVRTVEVLLDLRDARQREAAKDDTIAEQAAEIARLIAENETLAAEDEMAVVVQNYYDLGREFGCDVGDTEREIASPFDAILAWKERTESEIARLKRDAATREREALSSCSLADLQMELHMRALKVLGNPWESVQGALTPPQEGEGHAK